MSLAELHASPFYSWWIVAADGLLSLKIPGRWAWWIAPGVKHPPTIILPFQTRRKWNLNNVPLTHHAYFECAASSIFLKSVYYPALALSFYSSCISTNIDGRKKSMLNEKKSNKLGFIWCSHYPFYYALLWQTPVHSSHQSQLHTSVCRTTWGQVSIAV